MKTARPMLILAAALLLLWSCSGANGTHARAASAASAHAALSRRPATSPREENALNGTHSRAASAASAHAALSQQPASSPRDGNALNGPQSITEGVPISRDDAIDQYWDDIRDDLDGSEDVEACSTESGICYNLEADISDGQVDEIHFPNGGYLMFSADIDSDGTASDSDENGDDWSFTIDMNSQLVDDAIDDWANENGYSVQ